MFYYPGAGCSCIDRPLGSARPVARVLELLSCSGVGGMNEVDKRMVSVVGRPARIDQSY
jgi:hypothetical protein